jgi:hypothetical protein
MSWKSCALFSVLHAVFITSCGQELPRSAAGGVKGVAVPALKWSKPQAIPICWIEEDRYEPELAAALRAVVEREYEGKTVIRFTGWKKCRSKTESVIRVRLTDEEEGSGISIVGDPGKFLLDPPDGDGDETMRIGVASWPRKKGEILFAFLHEIGHAVGLDHEHERSDRTKVCTLGDTPFDEISPDGADNRVYVGPYDPKSVMHYCARGSTLSKGDLEAIAFLYGKP